MCVSLPFVSHLPNSCHIFQILLGQHLSCLLCSVSCNKVSRYLRDKKMEDLVLCPVAFIGYPTVSYICLAYSLPLSTSEISAPSILCFLHQLIQSPLALLVLENRGKRKRSRSHRRYLWVDSEGGTHQFLHGHS